MAKNYNVVVRTQLTERYNMEDFAILGALLNRNGITKIATPLATGGVKYDIQRPKRTKSKLVDLTATTENGLKIMDNFSQADFETITAYVNKAYAIGVKYAPHDDLLIDFAGGIYANLLKQCINNITQTRMENLIAELIKDKTQENITVNWDTITADIREIYLKTDDYKDGTDKSNLVVLASPYAADMLAKEKGTIFRGETPIFGTGFKARENVNGVPVITCKTLNRFVLGTGATARKIAYIVLDMDAVITAYEGLALKTQDLGPFTFTGRYFYDLVKVIDPSRIIVKTFTVNPGKVGKLTNA